MTSEKKKREKHDEKQKKKDRARVFAIFFHVKLIQISRQESFQTSQKWMS